MEALKLFFAKWFLRAKIAAFIFAIWAVIYATNTIISPRIAFEYDDGLAYTGDTIRKALKDYETKQEDIWPKINSSCSNDRKKIIPYLIAFCFKLTAIKTDIIADRPKDESGCLKNRWAIAQDIYFPASPNEKYKLLEEKKYLLFFAASDDGIIQGKKAGIKTLRIKKNPKSESKYEHNPGKYLEKTIPLSEF